MHRMHVSCNVLIFWHACFMSCAHIFFDMHSYEHGNWHTYWVWLCRHHKSQRKNLHQLPRLYRRSKHTMRLWLSMAAPLWSWCCGVRRVDSTRATRLLACLMNHIGCHWASIAPIDKHNWSNTYWFLFNIFLRLTQSAWHVDFYSLFFKVDPVGLIGNARAHEPPGGSRRGEPH